MWLLLVFIQMTIKQDYCFILQLKIKKHLTAATFLKNFIILINEKNLRFVQNVTKLFYQNCVFISI